MLLIENLHATVADKPLLKALALPLLVLGLATGCATNWDRGYERWRGYVEGSGPYSKWARCIRDRSVLYLDPDSVDTPPVDLRTANESQIFTYVLADCRTFMAGQEWQNLSSKKLQELIADALQAFNSVDAGIMARQEAAIT